jgi:hypothetical protein
MLTKLNYFIPPEMLLQAKNNLPTIDFRLSLNQPTGRFFYDPWTVKDCFKNTVWNDILKTLPFEIGEARLILLKHGTCYHSHADIDDRYHLNISGNYCFLVNLDTTEMFETSNNGFWYNMSAMPRHSAVNFGHDDRVQLVVRQLLNDNFLKESVSIKIITNHTDLDLARFEFDNAISPWLNSANKNKIITDFSHSGKEAMFNIEKQYIQELLTILPKNFNLISS